MADARKLELVLNKKKILGSQFQPCCRSLKEQPRSFSGLVPGSSPGRPNPANRAANFVADPTETPVSRPRWPLSNRVLDHRLHGGPRQQQDV